jgi:hypothetical protein
MILPLSRCPIGLFIHGDELCLKTEYGSNEGRIDCYIVSTGEFFWGDPPQTIANQREQMVRPVTNDELTSVMESLRERWAVEGWDKSGIGYGDGTATHEAISEGGAAVTPLVDPKSHELAEYFLSDCELLIEGRVMALAQVIQSAIEDWLIEAREDGHIRTKSWPP